MPDSSSTLAGGKSPSAGQPPAGTLDSRFPVTSPTLLNAISASPESPRWNDFARLYEPVIRRYLERERVNFRTLQPADRDDLVQETFLAVMRALPSFRYNTEQGRFRGHLATIVRRLVVRHQRDFNRRPLAVEGTGENDAAPETSDAERELMVEIWTLALARVLGRKDLSPNTKAVFRRHVLENCPVGEVAEEFRMKPNAVYQIKDRILRAVRKELSAFGKGRVGLVDLHEALLAASPAERMEKPSDSSSGR